MNFIYAAALVFTFLAELFLFSADQFPQRELFKVVSGEIGGLDIVNDKFYVSTTWDPHILRYDLKGKLEKHEFLEQNQFCSRFIPYNDRLMLAPTHFYLSGTKDHDDALALFDNETLTSVTSRSIPYIIAATTLKDSIVARTISKNPKLIVLKCDDQNELQETSSFDCGQTFTFRTRNILASSSDGSVFSVETDQDQIVKRSILDLKEYTVIQPAGDGAHECIADELSKTLFVRNKRSVKLYDLSSGTFKQAIDFRRTSNFALHPQTQTLVITPDIENDFTHNKNQKDNIFFYDLRKLQSPITDHASHVHNFPLAGDPQNILRFSQSSSDQKLYISQRNAAIEIDYASLMSK